MTTAITTAEERDVGTGVGEKPPPLAMTEMLLGSLWLGRALPMVAELGIADELSGSARTVEELAAAAGEEADVSLLLCHPPHPAWDALTQAFMGT